MSKFRIDILSELASQLRFTPRETRAAQVDAAEVLLAEIERSKAYPVDYVIFRITGYHPKQTTPDLLTGLALQHDLGLLIEQVSDSLDQLSTELSQPVLPIDDVCARFNVTSKTIQRWRRKGLAARRFIFPDGKRRIGFLLGSVERFFARNCDQVRSDSNLTQPNDDELQSILRHGRRLAVACQCTVDEICLRVGRRVNRSPATVLHTIRKYDAEHPQQAIFTHAASAVTSEQRLIIKRGYRTGATLNRLAEQLHHPRHAIYRVLVEERAQQLSRKKVRFIDDPLLHGEDAAALIDAIIAQQPLGDVAPDSNEQSRCPRDLPPYLAELYRVPLLNKSQERGLFLKLNLHKYQFVQARRRLDPQFARARDLNYLESLLTQVQQVRNAIVQANLRLVVSVARKHLRGNLDLMELVSEGNVVLLRAVDSFDVSKGYKFSTYATLVLMKGFARSVTKLLQRGGLAGADESALSWMADSSTDLSMRNLVARDELNRLLLALDPRERAIVRGCWGVDQSQGSYDELGGRLGLSRQRIRQIERTALGKLREMVRPASDAINLARGGEKTASTRRPVR
ncbi:MAG: sigma-70 family RNA polymerase sigma factor [Phycisphaerales bacterium]|nr:sigma-70 family RNA polymerase sigma factor [Phycisphaerales bacterium]